MGVSLTHNFGGKYPQMPLYEFGISKAKAKDKPYKLSEGEGLYLLVNPNGSKLCRQKYRYMSKE